MQFYLEKMIYNENINSTFYLLFMIINKLIIKTQIICHKNTERLFKKIITYDLKIPKNALTKFFKKFLKIKSTLNY